MKILEHWFGLGLLTPIIILTTYTIVHAQTDHMSTCTVNLQVCSNELSSTPGPNGIIRANVDDHPVANPPAFNRILIIFHWEYLPQYHFSYCHNGWCPVVKAAAGGSYIGGGGAYHCPFNCYLQVPNHDTYDPQFTLWEWWSARERSDGTIYDVMTGRPSL